MVAVRGVALSLAALPLASCKGNARPGLEAPRPAGLELVYRKASGGAFSAAEVEGLSEVLERRVGARARVSFEDERRRCVVATRAADEAEALALRPTIEVVGALSFEGVATDGVPQGFSHARELERLEAWWGAQQRPSIAAYAAVPRGSGGPPVGVRWRARRGAEDGAPQSPTTAVPCLRMDVAHPDHPWIFTEADIGRAEPTVDRNGWPAVLFELRPERREAFRAFTGAYVDEQVAIVLDEAVVSAPVIESAIFGPAAISGRFEDAEAEALVAALRSGRLPCALELVELRPAGGS